MATFNFASKRDWTESPFWRGAERAGLYNDRPRNTNGKFTTIVRHRGSGDFSMEALPFDYEVFLLSGDLQIEGVAMAPGDHCAIQQGEAVKGRTIDGCEHLIIAR